MSDMSPELNQAPPKKDRRNDNRSLKSRLKKAAGKVILGTPIAGLILSSGNVDNPNIPAPNIKDPTPAVVPLPGNRSHNTELTQPYTPTKNPNSKQEQSGSKELIPYSPSITIVDAAPSEPTKGLIQKEFISNEKMMRNVLGDKLISREQIIQEFGQNYEEKWDEIVSKYPQALMYRFGDTYFNHGENVVGVVDITFKRSGLKSTGINMLPLQKIFDKDSITFIKDASGNPGVSLNFDSKRITELLKNDSSRIINASFQVGNVELYQVAKVRTEVIPKYDQNDPRFSGEGLGGELDGKEVLYQGAVGIRTENGRVVYYDVEGREITPISLEELEKRKLENSEIKEHKSTELIMNGAYTKEKAMENLPKLFEVCDAYPDKFFVFAGGNTGEDFREAMEDLQDKVPKNLLIVGEWIKYDYGMGVYEGPAMEYGKYGQVLGPDIYVYNGGSNSAHGSSFSAPELAAEIDILLSKGLSIEQAKAKILASSDINTLQLADGTQYTARVFNPQLLKTE